MRRAYVSYLVTVAILLVLFALGLWFMSVVWSNSLARAPIPPFLTRKTNKQVTTTVLFNPSVEALESSSVPKPVITAKAALTYDLSTGKTLYAKNPKERLPIASLTKIMTAILAMENQRRDDTYVVGSTDLVGENSMGLSAGEVLTLEELLYGLILPSGNDAAEVLAANFLGGRSAFITAMNQKAASLGLTDTNFTNPSGLEGDGNQYSSAYDLLVVTNHALSRFPLFRSVVATVEHVLPYSEKHKAFFLYNETNLLTTYPGVRGVKTGYTEEAGLCLVSYLEYGNHRIIAVLLGSSNRRAEMKDLLDFSLKTLGVTPPKHN